MYECPNCAGNLKFNIGMQQLYCEHCDTTMPPYSFHKESDAEEQEYFEVTIFTCPQCGGELLTEDNTVATFCSYCGSSTILFSRISEEKRPKYIIPFTKTKEECRSSYKKMVNKAFFAPKELRDETHIEKFRGIYMPYWLYSFRKNGTSSFKGAKKIYETNHNVIKHYNINCEVTAKYDDISFDGSSTFYDNLSRAIAPFDTSKKKPFTPAYLSGFYADRSDVDADTYLLDAEEVVLCDIRKKLEKCKELKEHDIEEHMKNVRLRDTLKPDSTYIELAMFPVWFLSYRKKDRVAYAIVNGQTGEAAADLPIDVKRFIINSLLLAIPIILLLNTFLTLTPTALLGWCAVIASFFAIVANGMTTNILLKESCEDIRLVKAQDIEAKRQKEKLKLLLGFLIFAAIELPFLYGFLFVAASKNLLVIPAVITAIFILYLGLDLAHLHKPKDTANLNIDIYNKAWKMKLHILLKPLFTIVLALIVAFINPVSDIIYYGTGCVCLGSIFWTTLDIIECHNILTTRKLPQLGKRGGEEYV